MGIGDILTPRFLEAVDVHSPARQQQEVWQMAVAETRLNRHLAFDWRYTQGEVDLPDEIITKKKQGFGLPFGPWAVKDAALRRAWPSAAWRGASSSSRCCASGCRSTRATTAKWCGY